MSFIGFFRRPLRDQFLILQAALLMVAVRAGLATIPFATLRALLTRLARGGNGRRLQADANGIDRTVRTVEALGRRFPTIGTCLIQALSAHVLLARRGLPSDLRIGVTREEGEFTAHAWLEKDGTILIGASPAKRYTPMPALNGLKR